jgi:uncharacterized protein
MARFILTALVLALTVLVIVILVLDLLGIMPGSARGGSPVSLPVGGGQPAATYIATGQFAGISVSGDGVAKGKPDIARTQVVVDVNGPNIVDVQRDAATRMDKVMARLKELGIPQDDIKTVQYAIYPQYDYGQGKTAPTQIGFRVLNSVSVTIRQLDKVPAILDGVTVAGATRIDNVSFTIDDPTALQTQARALAMKQAAARAGELAKSAGVSLGKVTAIGENSGQGVPYAVPMAYDAGAGSASAQTPISAGELEIHVTVQVTYGIQ